MSIVTSTELISVNNSFTPVGSVPTPVQAPKQALKHLACLRGTNYFPDIHGLDEKEFTFMDSRVFTVFDTSVFCLQINTSSKHQEKLLQIIDETIRVTVLAKIICEYAEISEQVVLKIHSSRRKHRDNGKKGHPCYQLLPYSDIYILEDSLDKEKARMLFESNQLTIDRTHYGIYHPNLDLNIQLGLASWPTFQLENVYNFTTQMHYCPDQYPKAYEKMLENFSGRYLTQLNFADLNINRTYGLNIKTTKENEILQVVKEFMPNLTLANLVMEYVMPQRFISFVLFDETMHARNYQIPIRRIARDMYLVQRQAKNMEPYLIYRANEYVLSCNKEYGIFHPGQDIGNIQLRTFDEKTFEPVDSELVEIMSV